jgi:hypothetical protein
VERGLEEEVNEEESFDRERFNATGEERLLFEAAKVELLLLPPPCTLIYMPFIDVIRTTPRGVFTLLLLGVVGGVREELRSVFVKSILSQYSNTHT